MASQNIDIIINAKDMASKALKNVEGSMGGLRRGLEANKAAFQKMTAVGTAALAGLSYGANKFINANKEQQKAVALVERGMERVSDTWTRTTDDMIAEAGRLQQNSIFGDEQILQGVTNNLLTFGGIGEEVFIRAQQTAIDLSATLEQDLQSSAIMLGKALEDPARGLTALRRVGISFTEQQQEMITQMAQSGDVIGAQNLMLQEIEKMYGGAGKAAAEAAGSSHQLGKELGDLQEVIGGALQPALDGLSEAVRPVIQRISEWIQENPELTKKIVIVTGAIVGIVAILGTLGLIIGPITVALGALGTAFMLATGPVGLIVTAIAAGIAIGYQIMKNWDRIKQSLHSFGASIHQFKEKAVQAFGHLRTATIEKFNELINNAKQWGSNMVGMFVDGIKAKLGAVKDSVVGVAGTIANYLGFHSPTKEGPASDSDKWMPNLINMLASGLNKGGDKIQKSVDDIALKFLGLNSVGKTLEETFGIDEISDRYISLKSELKSITSIKSDLTEEDKKRIAALKEEVTQIKTVMSAEKVANADKYSALSETEKTMMRVSLAQKKAFNMERVQGFKDSVQKAKETLDGMKQGFKTAFNDVQTQIKGSSDKISGMRNELQKLNSELKSLQGRSQEVELGGKEDLAKRALAIEEELKNKEIDLIRKKELEEELAFAKQEAGIQAMQEAREWAAMTESERIVASTLEKKQAIDVEIEGVKRLIEEKNIAIAEEEEKLTELKNKKISFENEFQELFMENAVERQKSIDEAIRSMIRLNAMSRNRNNGISGTRAQGGNVVAGQAYEVGEQGRELFIPRTSGTIVSNENLRNSSGITINMGGVAIQNSADEDRLIEKMKTMLKKESKAFNLGIA